MLVSKLIRRSLQLAGIVESGATVSAQEEADALDDLNDMLAEWLDQGIGVYSGTLTTSDSLADAGDVRAVRYNLAAELHNSYYRNQPMPSKLEITANDLFMDLQAKYSTIEAAEYDKGLTQSDNYRFNILTD